MREKYEHIHYGCVKAPKKGGEMPLPVSLTEETMQSRKQKVLAAMDHWSLDALCVYADREHGGNFGYLTGFEPRFEEVVLVLHKDGTCFLLLGNESLRMGSFSRIPNTVVHVPHFSLPNQPMEADGRKEKTLLQCFEEAGLGRGMRVGIAGWKMFTTAWEAPYQLFDTPSFIVEAVRGCVGAEGDCISAGALFIHPQIGVRVRCNANEIAHFEYGAALASRCVYDVLEAIEPGKTELELGSFLGAFGQPWSVQAICATGERFTQAEVAPRNKAVTVGDTFSVTMGLRGGLTSRSGYVVSKVDELPAQVSDYLDVVVKPYYAAAVGWYETMGIGVTGGQLYAAVNEIIPKESFGWVLNPGHLTASEEWLSSPIYKDSQIKVESGMMFQMDILPKRPGYGGSNCEDGIAVADAALREQIAADYPKVWDRMMARRAYMEEILGICLKPEILPLSDTEGYLRPLLLAKDKAMYVKRCANKDVFSCE